MEKVRKVSYCYVKVPNRPGQGNGLLATLAEEGVDLLAFTGFPLKGRVAQVDLVPESMSDLRRVARREGWRVSAVKKGFLIQGDDKPGIVHRHLDRLAQQKVNVVAADAVAAGKGRYGMILWVRPKDYARAARALRAR